MRCESTGVPCPLWWLSVVLWNFFFVWYLSIKISDLHQKRLHHFAFIFCHRLSAKYFSGADQRFCLGRGRPALKFAEGNEPNMIQGQDAWEKDKQSHLEDLLKVKEGTTRNCFGFPSWAIFRWNFYRRCVSRSSWTRSRSAWVTTRWNAPRTWVAWGSCWRRRRSRRRNSKHVRHHVTPVSSINE